MNVKLTQALSEAISKKLADEDRELLVHIEFQYRWSVQNLKQCSQWLVDARMWREEGFIARLQGLLLLAQEKGEKGNFTQAGKWLFAEVRQEWEKLLRTPREYPDKALREFRPRYRYEEGEIKGNPFRLCPAASEKAVCCNLKTLSVVDNCAMGCSYCVLQNHYEEDVIKIPTNLPEKLAEIHIPDNKRYRVGTGEYSDSLLWGNTGNILDSLFDWAEGKENILLELKTKSSNIKHLLENPVPGNVVASWSLNPETIIRHEEQGTATLERRLYAARQVADRGLRVGFHVHPMMYYAGWKEDYQELIQKIMDRFAPEEVMWVSFGCVTMLKGFAEELRNNFNHSKLLQMPTELTPDNKLTYAFDIREQLYCNVLETLSPWQDKVYSYLCMEHKPMWDRVMPRTYGSMGEFNDHFCEMIWPKLPGFHRI